MFVECGAMPKDNPCFGCENRTATCHADCRKHKLYRDICRAHRNKYAEDMKNFLAPMVDNIYRSDTMSGKAPILQTVKHKKNLKGEIR